jgi:uncharacterized protein (TIGR00251 family)
MQMTKTVLVKTGSSKAPLVKENPDGSLTVWTNKHPVNGEANAEVCKILKKFYHRPVLILKGEKSKHKIVQIG